MKSLFFTYLLLNLGSAFGETVWQFDDTVQIPISNERMKCTDMGSSGDIFASYIRLTWPEYSSVGGELSYYPLHGMASSNNRDYGSKCLFKVDQYLRWASANGGTLPVHVEAIREIKVISYCPPSSTYGSCEDRGGYINRKAILEKLTITFPDGLKFGADGILKYLD